MPISALASATSLEFVVFFGRTGDCVIGRRIAAESSECIRESSMASNSRKQITMYSRLGDIPATIEKLRSDPELQSRIEGRESAFTMAMREALANAITHANHNEASRIVHVRYICEPGHPLSILIRAEGDGFGPNSAQSPKATDSDQRTGIYWMKLAMDEVRFRKNGTEIYMRMNERESHHPEGSIPPERSRETSHVESHG
jgi:anti-sigma regulatory factor (Ser/Thr protein kinase)